MNDKRMLKMVWQGNSPKLRRKTVGLAGRQARLSFIAQYAMKKGCRGNVPRRFQEGAQVAPATAEGNLGFPSGEAKPTRLGRRIKCVRTFKK
jgi:hypothetical protein